jgi:uncharacterized protein YeaO (DUF488 family)
MVVQGPRGIRAGYGRRVEIRLKRIYDEPDREDGTRILADRLWARGITKERARIALWAKDVAPSTELRKWYDHDPERFEEFEALPSRRPREAAQGRPQDLMSKPG